MASIGWIDFSTNDRDRIGSVLDMLRPEGMVDELGLGTIRDALANQLFPGISTIQTKAKYFFIIPYILLDFQALKPAQRKGRSVLKYLEDQEYEVMWYLAEDVYKHEEGSGVIGITKSKPEKIIRRPSAIYWNGLYTYRFLDTKGLSANVFLKQAVNPSLETLVSVSQGDDATGDDADAEHDNMFRIRIPTRQNWRNNLTLDLHRDEAEIFRDRIVSIAKNKLLAELLQNDKLWNVFTASEDFMEFAKASISFALPGSIESMIILAHDFSELMYGAHLAYNCQLQNRVFNNSFFDAEWEAWVEGLQDNMLDYSSFNPDLLLGYAKTTRKPTAQFVKDWWKQAQAGFPNINKRNSLVEDQEGNVKGGKARLRWNKTEDVKENTRLGLTYFDYRFSQAHTILNDIRTGLNQ